MNILCYFPFKRALTNEGEDPVWTRLNWTPPTTATSA